GDVAAAQEVRGVLRGNLDLPDRPLRPGVHPAASGRLAAVAAIPVTELSPVAAPAWRGRVAYATLAIVAIVSAATFLVAPHYRALVEYGLYAIPAHLLISFLPHEPYLFYVAKLYPPQLIASVGTTACIAAIVLDYW